MIRVDNFDELNAACRRIAPLLSDLPDEEERRFLLVEAFLPGTEVALEGVLAAGQLRVLAIFDKPDPLEGPFFEETYYVTPSRLDNALQRAVTKAVEAGCRAYGLRQGPVHAELRIVGGTPHVLEIAARTIGVIVPGCSRSARVRASRRSSCVKRWASLFESNRVRGPQRC